MFKGFEENEAMETISFDYLYPGLVVPGDIYNHSGKLLLVAKGIALNDVMLKRLKKFNDLQRNIKVSSTLRKELTNKGLPKKLDQSAFENETGYSKIKHRTMSIIAIAQISNQVSYEQVSDAGSMVMDHVNSTDPAIILQWLNSHKDVDEYLYRHSTNVAIINGLIGKWLGMNKEEIEELVLLGLVHDIGKTRLPSGILNGPGELTGKELELVKKHTVYSYEMLKSGGQFSNDIIMAARGHHERMNGGGYPDGLSADSIPFYARITAISNTYDVMVSERSYKHAQNPFKVLAQMQTEQFSELDIRLVKLFNQQMPQELVGKSVLMSDGSAGILRYINAQNIEYPVVDTGGEIIQTNKDLYCVSMIIDD